MMPQNRSFANVTGSSLLDLVFASAIISFALAATVHQQLSGLKAVERFSNNREINLVADALPNLLGAIVNSESVDRSSLEVSMRSFEHDYHVSCLQITGKEIRFELFETFACQLSTKDRLVQQIEISVPRNGTQLNYSVET